MIKKIFTIYDCKAEVYLPPFFENTKGSAIRAIQDSMNNSDSVAHIHKNDLSLFYIGEYDDQTAIVKAVVPRECLGTLNDLDPSKENNINEL